MSVELEELFHDLDAPTMSVSADSVVASGQRKVRRRRALWGAGTGALAAAAAVAIAVGTALPDSSSTSPMPAHSSSAVALGSFFLHAGQDGGRATDRVTSTPMGKTNGADPTPSTTYQIYRYEAFCVFANSLRRGRPIYLQPPDSRMAEAQPMTAIKR